jgi:hypothetical protein
MERRVFRTVPLLVALLASAAGVSCGSGLHDGDEEQSTVQTVGKGGGTIEFMGGRLDVPSDSLTDDVQIKFAWHRKMSPTGARSSIYEIELSSPDALQTDPTLTIATTPEFAADPDSAIGFLQWNAGRDWWVPDQTPTRPTCDSPSSEVCGPIQLGSFKDADTHVLRLAIVKMCEGEGHSKTCPHGQSCNGGACQQCPDPGCP